MVEMTPENIRNSEVKGFLRHQKELGGVVPSKLKVGQTLLIETYNYIYGVEVLENHEYEITTSSLLCQDNKLAVKLQSHSSKIKYDMPDWIGKGMRLVITFKSGLEVIVGEITGMTVTGIKANGEEYNLSLWD